MGKDKSASKMDLAPRFRLDQTIILCLILLFIISLVAVYSGSGQYASGNPTYYLKRQLLWYGVGIAIIAIIMSFDYELLPNFSLYFYIVGMAMLVFVEFYGVERNGAVRWIEVTEGFLLQPSEFVKIFLIIHLGAVIDKFKKKYEFTFKNQLLLTAILAAWSLPPFFLIFKQPDLGSALVVVAIVFTLLFMCGISFKILAGIIGLIASVIGSIVYIYFYNSELFAKIIDGREHQLERIYGWLTPEQYASSFGYQHLQATTGIGAGQMTGLGFTKGIQSQNGKVPEVHTDFVFTVIAEEFGFIGASVLISIYFILFFRMIIIALESNSDYGTYLTVGVIGLLAFQIFQNIGMTIGLMPITGIALPFISYGGSALWTNMMAVGIVLSVRFRTKTYMF